MSVETGFLDIGFLVSDFDARNSTVTGTTLAGLLGSGQFLFVRASTANALAFALSSGGSTLPVLGVLQNKPSTGIAGDVKIEGVSKVVYGSTATAVTQGSRLSLSATSSGAVAAFSSTATFVGVALEAPTTVGQIFSASLYTGFPSVQPA